MRLRINRGAREIGGNCIELEAHGSRLVMDVGRPLWAKRGEQVPLPEVTGFSTPDPSLVGVILSHGHWDHCGLAPLLPKHVPVYLGAAAERMLQASRFFVRDAPQFPVTGHLADRVPLRLGSFTATPFLNDHSAFDAYSLLVEADGHRVFYTGDFRAHGRKGKLFEKLVRRPPADVDVLLMEGTHLTESAQEPTGLSEADVEDEFVRLFSEARGLALPVLSGQNIDRLVTVYRAARRAGRTLVVDLYTHTMARATGQPSIPQAGHDSLRVYVPESDRRRVKRASEFHRTEEVRDVRVFRRELQSDPSRFVMIFRQSMAEELARDGLLDGAVAIWSLWRGYLDDAFRELLAKHGANLKFAHSSGHAWPADLRRLVTAMLPRRVIPIHTASPRLARAMSTSVRVVPDGAWLEVRNV